MPSRPLLALAVTATVAAPAGCGSGGRGDPAARGGDSDAQVIRGWADSERAGDTSRAASYFALPAIVANGTPPLRLATRSEVVAFNRALPCGAQLLRTVADRGYTVATFRLTNRPGASCQGAEGAVAYAAFRVRDGKIAQWIRVPGEAAPGIMAPPVPGGAPRAPGAPGSDSGPVV